MDDREIGQFAKERYIERLKYLYSDISTWIKDINPDAVFSNPDFELSEEIVGKYVAPGLRIDKINNHRIELIPRGAFIIGAQGRVDIHSDLAREVFLWIVGNGPRFRIIESDESGPISQHEKSLYKNAKEGWAWAERTKKGIKHLDRRVFTDELLKILAK